MDITKDCIIEKVLADDINKNNIKKIFLYILMAAFYTKNTEGDACTTAELSILLEKFLNAGFTNIKERYKIDHPDGNDAGFIKYMTLNGDEVLNSFIDTYGEK